jgi:hypothetical protein
MAALSVSVVVCGPSGASGVVYVSVEGMPATCGTDEAGNALQLQVDNAVVVSSGSETPLSGGAEAGMLIGGAVFMVLAVAFGLRTLRRFLESSSEG